MSENPPDPSPGDDPGEFVRVVMHEYSRRQERWYTRHIRLTRVVWWLIGAVGGSSIVQHGWRGLVVHVSLLVGIWYGLDGVAWVWKRWRKR